MGWNRRGFLGGLLSIPGAAALLGNAAAQDAARDVYKELGIRPLVNAAGSYTYLSATLLPGPVREAMESAARKYVNLFELQEAVGKRISALVGCEAALVTAGTASALTLGTAACVTGKDRDKIRRVPDTAGMKNEVVLQKSHRNGYDHAVRNVGVRLVDVETVEALERAVNERTAALLFFNVHEGAGRIKAEEFARLGKKLGVPTFIDIAADVPPAENLTRFHKLGYDLVAVSGGKGLRGPQCSGILMGRKDLIEAAALNNNPHTDAICRTNKVGKEEIVGVWAALEEFLRRDPAATWKEWERRCKVIVDRLSDIPNINPETFVPEIANAVPHVRLTWGIPNKIVPPDEVQRKLRAGEPRIELRAVNQYSVEIAVWTLEPGEEEVVAGRLRETLKGK